MFRRIVRSKYSAIVAVAAFLLGIAFYSFFAVPETTTRIEEPPKPAYAVTDANERRWDVRTEALKEHYREVSQILLDFQQAVAADDREKVSSLMMYPAEITYFSDRVRPYRHVDTKEEFLRVYDKIFHRSVKQKIQNAQPEELQGTNYFLHEDMSQIGVCFKYPRDCPECPLEVKVCKIPSDLIYKKYLERGHTLPWE